MGLDSAVGVEWVVDYLKGDATLVALLAGTGVYRDSVPRGVDLTQKPAIVVGLQSTRPPWNPLNRGRQTNIYTSTTVNTKGAMQGASYVQLRAVANRLLELMDGKVFQSANGGTVYSCIKQQDFMHESTEGNVVYKNIDIMWEINAKSN